MMKAKLIRYAQYAVAVTAMGALCWIGYSIVIYLTSAPRFDVQKLSVSGLKRVTENEVLAQAGFEIGTNVFRADLQQIREQVEEIRRVRHALVERVLPDQIIIKVVEREPVGIGRIQGEIYQFDYDATILDPDPGGGVSFPVLDGLRADDPEGNLAKVEAYRTVLNDLGETALSEVHVNDSGEVTVVSANDPVAVNIGSTDFRSRWIKYLQLKPQIQEQYPLAVRVDLRFKNQVIVQLSNDEAGENIVWDVEKKAL
jgi:cell division protein FtsQ